MEHATQLDWQILFNLVAGILLTCLGWFLLKMWDNQEKMSNNLQRLEVNFTNDFKKVETDLSNVYVRRDEFFQTMKEVKDMLVRIDDKLDRKVDK